MTANDTYLGLCQRALADVGTRSTITDLAPPFGGGTDGSTESNLCGLYIADVRDQLLRAARWNFGKKTSQLSLFKASPGTQENPLVLAGRTGWSRAYPAPPWLYAYYYPVDALYIQRLIGPSPQTNNSPPIFSGVTNLLSAYPRTPYSKFEIATDAADASGNAIAFTNALSTITIANAGSGYLPGDVIVLANTQYQTPTVIGPAGWPQSIILSVGVVNTTGGILVIGVEGVGSYIYIPTNPVPVAFTTSSAGTGATFTVTMLSNAVINPPQTKTKVILTNIQSAVAEYTHNYTIPFDYDSQFATAFYTAMAGKLAQPLTGDKALARDKITIANGMILDARVADANEALTINDHVPDWLRLRGVGGGLGFEDTFFAPYGPLFPSPSPF